MELDKRALDFEKPLHDLELELKSLIEKSQESDIDLRDEIKSIEVKIESTKKKIYSQLTPWQKVQIPRKICIATSDVRNRRDIARRFA